MTDRLTAVRKSLDTGTLDSILVSSVPHIIWLTGYAGFSQFERECYLLITKKIAYLFTDLRYTEAVRILVPHFQTMEIGGNNPFIKQLTELAERHNIHTVGFETENITVSEFVRLKKTNLKLKAIDLSELRIEKTKDEIASIQNACALGDKTFAYICKEIKSGMTEKEIAREMELFVREHDGEMSFPTIAAFGPHAAVPHHMTGETVLKKTDVILLDFGVKYKNYCSDMTRTVFLGGPTEEQERIYETVLGAQQATIAYIQTMLKTGKTPDAADADNAAREYIMNNDYPSIPHSLGHGIGLEVHEAPNLSPRSGFELTDGMVFSIEPGIYLNGKFGVRIEDLFVVQGNKLAQLTHAPSTLTSL